MRPVNWSFFLLLGLALLAPLNTANAQVPVNVILKDGDLSGGDPVASVNAPFTDGNGLVGFTGSLTTATGTNEFAAYSGTISIREGDTIDGVTLTSAASLRVASINNAGFELQMQSVAVRTWHAMSQPKAVHTHSSFSNPEWQTLGFVEGYGTTQEPQTYSYRVTDLEAGTYRFRLKQIDFDGAFEFSPVVEAAVEVPDLFSLSEAYPNPFTTDAQFALAVPTDQQVQINLYDMMGRQVRNLFDGTLPAHQTRTFRINGEGLSGGVYVYRIQTPTFTETRKVMLVK